MNCFFIWSLLLIAVADCSSPYQIQTNYLDGLGAVECREKLEKRVSGFSGLIFSHQPYRGFYPKGKNCLLVITVPIGYRIRLNALDFYVDGTSSKNVCKKDTLHVFDTESPVDGRKSREPGGNLGPIVGQFCGRKRNGSELVASTHNALTLWWHTDDSQRDGPGRGFRLLWSAFRDGTQSGCSRLREFQCRNSVCIPDELACDQLANCFDQSDIDSDLQREHGCPELSKGDMFDSIPGAILFGLCLTIIIGSVLSCVCLSICCRSTVSRPVKSGVGEQNSTRSHTQPMLYYHQQPASQHITHNHLQQQQQIQQQQIQQQQQVLMVTNDYGIPNDSNQFYVQNGDYTYTKTETSRTLLRI